MPFLIQNKNNLQYRLISKGYSCFLSSSTLTLVSFLSGSASPLFAATEIQINECEITFINSVITRKIIK